MSVFIRGMQIPSECSVCPMIQYGVFSGNTWCTLCSINKTVLAMDFKTIQFEGRHKDCPLVDLVSHGDLIDRQKLLEEMVYIGNRPTSTWLQYIKALPAIIEAEGAEK